MPATRPTAAAPKMSHREVAAEEARHVGLWRPASVERGVLRRWPLSYHRLGEVPAKRHVALSGAGRSPVHRKRSSARGVIGRPTRSCTTATRRPGSPRWPTPTADRPGPPAGGPRSCATTYSGRRHLAPKADRRAGRAHCAAPQRRRAAIGCPYVRQEPGAVRAQRRRRRVPLRPRGRRATGVGLRGPRLPGRRLRRGAARHDAPVGAGGPRQSPPRRRKPAGDRAPAALPERGGPAARARSVLGARLPPADRAGGPTTRRPFDVWVRRRRPVRPSTRSTTIRSTSSGGTATSIPTRSPSTTSSPSPAASTSRRPSIRPSSSTARWCARSCPRRLDDGPGRRDRAVQPRQPRQRRDPLLRQR